MIDRLIRSRVHWFLFVGFALFAIACTSAPTATPRPTSTPVPTAAPTPPATTAATNEPDLARLERASRHDSITPFFRCSGAPLRARRAKSRGPGRSSLRGRYDAIAKERLTDADQGSALFDGDLQVTRHAHRQRRVGELGVESGDHPSKFS